MRCVCYNSETMYAKVRLHFIQDQLFQPSADQPT